MRIVVTGGSGKAGREVVRALADHGHEVANLDRVAMPSLPGAHRRVELADAGETYDALLQFRPEAVCHLAADPSPDAQARVNVFSGNVLSAYHMLQAAGDIGVRRVVYASSETVTGLLEPGVTPAWIPFDETERHPSPSAYALSKYLSEVIADSMTVRYPDTAFVGLRINNVIAPDGYEVLQERRDDPARGVSNFWSYIDARDVGGAFRAACEGDSSGHEVFLVAAADTSAERGLRDLMATYYDGYDGVADDHDDFASAFDCGKITRHFGWRPLHSWRDPGPDAG